MAPVADLDVVEKKKLCPAENRNPSFQPEASHFSDLPRHEHDATEVECSTVYITARSTKV
jgi:hypothetical protein